jgi:hypothetical protein
VEARLGLEEKRIYPCCIGGKRRAPTEDCGGPRAFVARRDEVPLAVEELIEDIRDDLDANDLESIRNRIGDIDELREWLTRDSFDRRAVNPAAPATDCLVAHNHATLERTATLRYRAGSLELKMPAHRATYNGRPKAVTVIRRLRSPPMRQSPTLQFVWPWGQYGTRNYQVKRRLRRK